MLVGHPRRYNQCGPKLFAMAVDRIQRPGATRSREASVNKVLVGIGKSLLGKGRTVCLMTSW